MCDSFSTSTNLIKFSPEAAPGLWYVINIWVLLYSAILLGLLVESEYDSAFHKFARRWYVTYNVVTCFIWLTEVSLVLLYIINTKNPTFNLSTDKLPNLWYSSLKWLLAANLIEWFLAFVLIIDAVLRVKRKNQMDLHTDDMVLGVVLNLLAYTYAVFVNTFTVLQPHGRKDEYTFIENTPFMDSNHNIITV